MAKRFDLGAYLAPTGAVSESDTREQIEYIDEARLRGDAGNFYSMEGVEELAQNIELIGLQQPLRVRPDPEDEGGYIVVSGHRRLTAIRTICKADEPERWRTVPCIVERGEQSSAMRELRLIYANSDTRRMSSADISAQAERVERLLYQLKEEGVEFPGRMRDHVAKVCQVSKSKLARMKVIREGLSKSPRIAEAWRKGELPEATAYRLAHLPEGLQDEIAYAYTHRKDYCGHGLMYLGERSVERIGEALEKLDALLCKHGCQCAELAQGKREHIIEVLMRSSWTQVACGDKCCRDCSEFASCKQACPQLLGAQDQLKADKRAAQKAKRERQAEADRPIIDEIRELWRRFGIARARAGKSVAECYAAGGNDYAPPEDSEVMQLESGEAEVTVTTDLPYDQGCDIREIHGFTRVADLLGVSLDYLLGRTEEQQTVPESDTAPAWRTGEPTEAGEYYCRFSCDGCEVYQIAAWNAVLRQWEMLRGVSVEAEALGWWPLPPRAAEGV